MDLHPDLLKHSAGPAGAMTALLFMPGVPWPRRLGMLAAGCASSLYAGPYLAQNFAINDGLAGYLVGLLSMAAVAKLFSTWDALDLGKLLRRWLAKRLGVSEE